MPDKVHTKFNSNEFNTYHKTLKEILVIVVSLRLVTLPPTQLAQMNRYSMPLPAPTHKKYPKIDS